MDRFPCDLLHVHHVPSHHLPLTTTRHTDDTVHRRCLPHSRSHSNVAGPIYKLHVPHLWRHGRHRSGPHRCSIFGHHPRALRQVRLHSNGHRHRRHHIRPHVLLVRAAHAAAGARMAEDAVDPRLDRTADQFVRLHSARLARRTGVRGDWDRGEAGAREREQRS